MITLSTTKKLLEEAASTIEARVQSEIHTELEHLDARIKDACTRGKTSILVLKNAASALQDYVDEGYTITIQNYSDYLVLSWDQQKTNKPIEANKENLLQKWLKLLGNK